jgi:hypothetical protein
MMLQENFPYGMVSRGQQQNQISGQFLLAAYKAGDSVLARKVSASLRKDLEQQLNYYSSLDEDKMMALGRERDITDNLLKQVQQIDQMFTSMPSPVINPESSRTILNKPQLITKDTQVKDNKR